MVSDVLAHERCKRSAETGQGAKEMTEESEILAMAKQAGFDVYGKTITWDDVICTDEIKAYTKLVADKATQTEKERCAKIARLFHDLRYGNLPSKKSTKSSSKHVALEIEAAILAVEQT